MRTQLQKTMCVATIAVVMASCASDPSTPKSAPSGTASASNSKPATTPSSLAPTPPSPTLTIEGPRSIFLGVRELERQPFVAKLGSGNGRAVLPNTKVVWSVDEPALASVDSVGLLTLHAECVSFTVRAEYTTVEGVQLSADQSVMVRSDLIPPGGCPSERCIDDGREQGSIPIGRCLVNPNPVDVPV